MRFERFAGDWRRAGGGEFVEVAAHMRPAESKLHIAALGELAIAGIAVDLQDALEAGEMGDRPLGLAIGRIDIGDAGRVGAAPGPIVSGIGPELAGLGAARGRDRAPAPSSRRRTAWTAALSSSSRRSCTGRSMEGGTADPVRQRRAIEIDALPGVDLGLPVQRQMIGVFGDENLRDRRLGRQSALDQPRRRRRLHHPVLASPAGVFGPADDEHAELRRHDVEPLAPVLADPMQRALQHGQVLSSISTTISIRGRCAGSDPRFMRRLAARLRPAFRRGLVLAWPHQLPRPARRLRGQAASDLPAASRHVRPKR